MVDVQETERLMNEGFDSLESYEYEKALQIGKKLEEIGHSSAFEIMALAYEGTEDLDNAFDVLQRGTTMAPTVWILWQLLGNFYSDTSQWDEAQKAYDRALECPDVDRSTVNYNSALAFTREGSWNVALDRVSSISSEALRLKVTSLKIMAFTQLDRLDEAVEVAEDILSEVKSEEKNRRSEEAGDLARVYGTYAEAVWKSGRTEQALELAWKAIYLDKQLDRAAWLIRELEGRTSENSKYFRLMKIRNTSV